jgi:predicted DNA-binding transcriptional regulator YafY
VFVGKNFEAGTTSQNLTEIQMALTNFQVLRIAYRNADGAVSERLIEPFSLYNTFQEDWVVAAYCRLRKDFRTFRLDRIEKVEPLNEVFEPHKLTIEEFIKKYVSYNKP